MDYVIRPAREDELDALLALYRPYFAELKTFGMNYELDEDGLSGAILGRIKSRLLLAAVAEGGDGRLYGFVFCAVSRLSREYRCRGRGSIGSLQELYVAPEARRRGLATRLWECAKDWLRAQDVSAVQLQVLCGNPAALAFWRARGFAPLGTLCYQPLDETR